MHSKKTHFLFINLGRKARQSPLQQRQQSCVPAVVLDIRMFVVMEKGGCVPLGLTKRLILFLFVLNKCSNLSVRMSTALHNSHLGSGARTIAQSRESSV